MYHSWGSQNAWLRQISNANKLYMNRKRGAELDLKDDDWIEVSSHCLLYTSDAADEP